MFLFTLEAMIMIKMVNSRIEMVDEELKEFKLAYAHICGNTAISQYKRIKYACFLLKVFATVPAADREALFAKYKACKDRPAFLFAEGPSAAREDAPPGDDDDSDDSDDADDGEIEIEGDE